MKLWRNLAITVVVLGLLGGAYWYVTTLKGGDNTAKPQDATISLLSVKSDDIKEIHIKNPKREYTIAKINGKWGIKEYPDINFNTTKIENEVYDLTSINAKRIVEENPADLDKYGLKTPQAEVAITLGNGSVRTFQLGNKIESMYYLKDKDSPKVYVIDSYKGEAFLKDLNDYRDLNILTAKPEEVTGLKVVYKDGKVLDISKGTSEKGSFTSAFVMNSPYQGGVDSEKLNNLLTSLTPMDATGIVTDNAADAVKYGLGTPDYTVTVKTDKASVTFKMSKTDKVYAMVDGQSTIYTIDEAKYTAVANIDAFQMVEKFAHLINIENINAVTVEGKGKKYTLSISRTPDTAATPDPQTKKQPEKAEYSINGKRAEEEAFKGAYQAVIGLIVTDVARFQPQGDADYTITFSMRNGGSDVYRYVSYDARNYAVEGSGGTKYIILKKNLEAMMDKLGKFEADPSKKPE